MWSRNSLPRLSERRLTLVLLLLAVGALVPACANTLGVPISLGIEPAVVKQGDDAKTVLKTTVTLAAPSPGYFVCEVRSLDKRKVQCSNLIFKKGDSEGHSYATVSWGGIGGDTTVKIIAFNVEAPDAIVTFTLKLQVKAERIP